MVDLAVLHRALTPQPTLSADLLFLNAIALKCAQDHQQTVDLMSTLDLKLLALDWTSPCLEETTLLLTLTSLSTETLLPELEMLNEEWLFKATSSQEMDGLLDTKSMLLKLLLLLPLLLEEMLNGDLEPFTLTEATHPILKKTCLSEDLSLEQALLQAKLLDHAMETLDV